MTTIFRKYQGSMVIITMIAAGLFAQTHFTPIAISTGNNMTVFIASAIRPTINGVAMGKGDEIGVFDSTGQCTGGVKWDSVNNKAITVWGQNSQVTAEDGMAANERMRIRVWDSTASTEYTASAVFAAPGTTLPGGSGATSADSLYVSNGIAMITSIVANSAPAAPVLSAPAAGANNQATTLTLSWATVTGVATYTLQVSTVSSFANTIVNQSGITATSSIVGVLGSATTYFWHVRATNAVGTSAWSAIWSFTTIIGVPILATPLNGALNQLPTSLSLAWSAVNGAGSYAVRVSTVSTFGTTVFNPSGITGTSAIISSPLLNSTIYYWDVNATVGGSTSAWSAVWSFSTMSLPQPPSLSSPLNGSVVAAPGRSLTLSWGTVAGALSYSMQISTSANFAATILSRIGISGSSLGATGLAGSSIYYWRMNTTSVAGTSAWSGTWSFAISVSVVPEHDISVLEPSFSVKRSVVDYMISKTASVEISILDIRGRSVLKINRLEAAGRHRLLTGNYAISAGIYVIQFKIGGFVKQLPMIFDR